MFKHAPHVLLTMVCMAGSASIASAQGPGQVERRPNSQKYRDEGAKPATGRAGSASLEARALIAKEGTMLVEASTGSVGSAAGPHAITKTQVKIGNVTRNYRGSAGYWFDILPAVSRGTDVQVQANIRENTPPRTSVITVTAPALLRPDLAVDSVSGPAEHAPQAPVTFLAAVSEKNGDVGATADCLLTVNGEQVDAAAGTWVDAGDSVSCQLSHEFTEPGTYAVSVSAAGVAPADWDTANNVAHTTITIAEPGTAIEDGYMYALRRESRLESRTSRSGVYMYESERTELLDQAVAEITGANPRGASVLQQLDVELYVNGVLHHHASLAPTATSHYDDGQYFSSCAEHYLDFFDGSTWRRSSDRGSMCSSGLHADPSSHSTFYRYTRATGTVTYYGSNSVCSQAGDCSVYTWNDDSVYGSGIPEDWHAGTDVRLKVRFLDNAGVVHGADRTVTLVDRSGIVNYSGQSSYQWDGDVISSEWHSTGTLFVGEVAWGRYQ